MRQCVKLTREIFAQPAFDPYRGEELAPGADINTDQEIDEFVRRKGDSAYHPSCTCKVCFNTRIKVICDLFSPRWILRLKQRKTTCYSHVYLKGIHS